MSYFLRQRVVRALDDRSEGFLIGKYFPRHIADTSPFTMTREPTSSRALRGRIHTHAGRYAAGLRCTTARAPSPAFVRDKGVERHVLRLKGRERYPSRKTCRSPRRQGFCPRWTSFPVHNCLCHAVPPTMRRVLPHFSFCFHTVALARMACFSDKLSRSKVRVSVKTPARAPGVFTKKRYSAQTSSSVPAKNRISVTGFYGNGLARELTLLPV